MYIPVLILFVVAVFAERISKYYKHNAQGWKAEKISYKQIDYSEKINGEWQTIFIDADINIGTFEPHFKNREDWAKEYPDWAQDRTKIIDRVTSKFPLKDEIGLIGEKD